jgi:8-oxo-dGTP diphosphatase
VVADYHKVGLLIVRDGRMLLCRKRKGTSLLILPGGCIEEGESHRQCLERELREELGQVQVSELVYIGTYRETAAGQEGHRAKTVQIELYGGELTGTPSPHAEIAELVWFGPADDRAQLAPSIANRILPDLLGRSILPWSG